MCIDLYKEAMEINLKTYVEFDQHRHGIPLCVFHFIIEIAGWTHIIKIIKQE